MKKELEDTLFEKYPNIFGDRKQPCHFWGFECGDGWYMLIDTLCHDLQFNTDKNNSGGKYPQIVALQVKEKFGGLRFYVGRATEHQNGEISFAESMSYHICERCGSTDDVQQVGSWIKSLCKNCRNNKEVI